MANPSPAWAAPPVGSPQRGRANPPRRGRANPPQRGRAKVTSAQARMPQARAWYRTTPGKLSLVRSGCLLAIILFAVAAIWCGSAQASALRSVADASGRLASLQQVKHELVQADAAVANGFLRGGLETSDQRESYEGYLNHAASTLPGLAAADEHLDGVVADLTTYAGLIEQARANNRQGFPVGAGYLEQASTVLRGQVLTALDEATELQREEITSDLSRASSLSVWLPIVVVVLVAGLIAAQIWLARKSHRRFNPPLVLATVIVVGCGILATSAVVASDRRAQATAAGPYAAMNGWSAALADTSQAKALESRVLISRGANPQLSAEMEAAENRASEDLTRVQDLEYSTSRSNLDLHRAYRNWSRQHKEIASTYEGGDWDAAVAAATGTETTSANAWFKEFVTEVDEAVSSARAETAHELDAAAANTTLLCWIAGILALVAGIPTWLGFGRRIKEYR